MALIVTCRDRAPGRGGLRLRHRPGPARFSEWQKGVVDGHIDGPADGTRLSMS